MVSLPNHKFFFACTEFIEVAAFNYMQSNQIFKILFESKIFFLMKKLFILQINFFRIYPLEVAMLGRQFDFAGQIFCFVNCEKNMQPFTFKMSAKLKNWFAELVFYFFAKFFSDFSRDNFGKRSSMLYIVYAASRQIKMFANGVRQKQKLVSFFEKNFQANMVNCISSFYRLIICFHKRFLQVLVNHPLSYRRWQSSQKVLLVLAKNILQNRFCCNPAPRPFLSHIHSYSLK